MRLASSEEINIYNDYLNNEEPLEALKQLRKLYLKYPSDTLVIKELGLLLLKLNMNISEALLLLKTCMNRDNSDNINYNIGSYYLSIGDFYTAEDYFLKLSSKDEKSICYRNYGLLKVYLHTGEYERGIECTRILKKYSNTGIFTIGHLNNSRALIYYNLGIFKDEYKYDNYFTTQLVEYSKKRAIDHIKEHLEEKQLDDKDVIHSVFDKDINIEELYDKCLDFVEKNSPYSYSTVDYYLLELDREVGLTVADKRTKLVEIVTFPNSNKILSLYPSPSTPVNKRIKSLTGIRGEKLKVLTNTQKWKKESYKKKLKKKPKK